MVPRDLESRVPFVATLPSLGGLGCGPELPHITELSGGQLSGTQPLSQGQFGAQGRHLELVCYCPGMSQWP